MKQLATNLLRFLLAFWHQPKAALVAENKQKTRPARKQKPELLTGEFYFKENILERLDFYFRVLKRMRKGDRAAYDLYKIHGGIVLPGLIYKSSITDIKLDPWFLKTRPAFGAIFFGSAKWETKDEAEHDYIFPRALYFRKYKIDATPLHIQHVGSGDVYIGTVYWDDPDIAKGDKHYGKWDKYVGKKGIPQDYAIWVKDNGEVQALRILKDTTQTIRAKHGRDKGKTFTIPTRRWGFPNYEGSLTMKERSFQESLCQFFVLCANEWQHAAMGFTKVRATNNNLMALFAVNIERTPYFFKDREVTINKAGSRKRIFHIVRPHQRILADGRETYVRTHFRGEREFMWNKYKICITVPGWHHGNFAGFNVGGHDEDAEIEKGNKEVRKWLDDPQVATDFANYENTGRAAHHRRQRSSAP